MDTESSPPQQNIQTSEQNLIADTATNTHGEGQQNHATADSVSTSSSGACGDVTTQLTVAPTEPIICSKEEGGEKCVEMAAIITSPSTSSAVLESLDPGSVRDTQAQSVSLTIGSTNGDSSAAVASDLNSDYSCGCGKNLTCCHCSSCGCWDSVCLFMFGCSWTRGVSSELGAVWKMAWPVCLGYALQMILTVVNLIFIGRIKEDSKTEMAAASLAIMIANVTGYSFGIGLLSAIDTLASQAYGAGNFKKVGDILQRAVLIAWICCIPIAGLWGISKYLLLLMQQDPEISEMASQYVQILIPSLFPYFLYESIKRTLQAQGIVFPMMLVSGVSVVLLALLNWFFVIYLGLGLPGSAASLTLVYWAMPSMIIPFIFIRKLHLKTWGGLSRECVKNWKEFLSLGLPGVFMLCSEWWAFELLAILSGLIGTVELASNMVIMNTFSIVFMIPLGMSIVGGARVGNYLGGNNPIRAKMVSRLTMTITVLAALVQAGVLLGSHNVWARIYTNDEEVIKMVADLLLLCAPMSLLDGTQGCTSGILRGCGRQKYGACINLVSFYVVGIPLAASLAFAAHMGLWGLWIGDCVALLGMCTSVVLIVLFTKWPQLAEQVHRRETVEKPHNKPDDTTQTPTTSESVPVEVGEDSSARLVEMTTQSI
ncbi:solute carrier family 47 [Pelomyxa schiedti]|nr:solute carrier family 47 [Pelomyxa schiedti]